GCSGDDTISATALVDNVVLTATGQVTVEAATVGSIQFVSADPDNIASSPDGNARHEKQQG
ncbi:MAG: hypothetical protein ACE10C_06345, partial [Candidatus Binatia bacterium]